ncbi:hypothetical protein C8F01DRAFT_754005 [Mycena amicta]|nr:hypothetical protein C8F01DRAFT_754005 [Mycena amicta]
MLSRAFKDVVLTLIFLIASIVGASVLASPVTLNIFGLDRNHSRECKLSLSYDGLPKMPAVVLAGFCFLVAFVARFLRLWVTAETPPSPENGSIAKDDNAAAPNGVRIPLAFPAPAPIQLACVDCPAVFGDKGALAEHLEKVHWRIAWEDPPSFDDEPMECEEPGCGIWFLESELEDHDLHVHGISPNMRANSNQNSNIGDNFEDPNHPPLFSRGLAGYDSNHSHYDSDDSDPRWG